MKTDLDEKLLETARAAAVAAGACLLSMVGKAAVTQKDSGHNLLTEADLAAQKIIVDMIRHTYPEHGIIAEENGLDESRKSEYTWIIDPLDGTMNYAHGFPHFSVSIACCHNNMPVIGVVYNPVTRELFSARAGNGAHCNDIAIAVSARLHIQSALIMTGFYYDRGRMTTNTLNAVAALFNAGMGDIRRSGSAALDLCYVASGRIDGYFEYNLSVWDFAAGMLIVREAGGIVSDRSGTEMSLQGRGVIVSNGHLHQELLSVVRYPE